MEPSSAPIDKGLLGAIRIEIQTDNKPSETSFSLVSTIVDFTTGESKRTILADEGSLMGVVGANEQHDFTYHDINPHAILQLIVKATGGDGICCNHGLGHVLVHEVDNISGAMVTENVVTTDGQFGQLWDSQSFFLPSFHPTS